MLDSFRRLSKSKIGLAILVAFLVAILASFALGDVNSLRSGNFGLGSNTLAKVGGGEVSDRDLSRAMDQLLSRARQQNPAATLRDIAGEFDPVLQTLIQGQELIAFGDDHGLNLSKRLVDAEIAKLPQTRGLGGAFSDAAYQSFLAKERLTDAEVRRIIGTSLSQRLLLAPAVANARLSLGIVSPYAAMLMEQRQGQIALIPASAFAVGLKPTDAQVTAFYTAGSGRYMVPEQRSLRIARFGPDQVASAAPSEQEIAAYYNANQANYAAKDTRIISQAVVPDAAVAAGIAARAKAGGAFVAAAQPAGLTAQDVSVGPQTRSQFSDLAGEKVAAAAFAPGTKAGTIIGPLQSDLGWHVIRVESITSDPGKSLAAAHAEIAAKLAVDKRKDALTELVNRIQDGIDGGQSFADLVAKNKLPLSETPLLTAQGTAPADPAFKLPPDMAGALKSGFELSAQDAPVVETLPGDAGFALVALGKQVPAAPAPLERIRQQVAADWVVQQAGERARDTASAMAAKVAAGMPLAAAVGSAGVALPAARPVVARRVDLQQAPPALAAPLRMLFTLAEGKSRLVAIPTANAFAIVQVDKIVAGNALSQPALIAQVQSQFQQGASEEYGQQFLNAIGAIVGVARNEPAIAAARQRLTAAPGAAE